MQGTEEITQEAAGHAATALEVFLAWVFTPTGALLLVLAILFGGAGLVMRFVGAGRRFAGLFMTFMGVAGFLFFVWVISGLLEVWGIPVREWLAQIGSMLPDVGSALMQFFERLLFTAG